MKRRIDPGLAIIGVIGLAALALMSVASYEFFGYVLPAKELALASTVVMAAGLPALKVAARITPSPDRARGFKAALWALLSVELVAQYFKAQANFSRQVTMRADLAGSDLAAAAASGWASRLLAFVFLASMPFVVVLCVDAAVDRWIALAPGRRRGRTLARIRSRVARLRAALAGAVRRADHLVRERDQVVRERDHLVREAERVPDLLAIRDREADQLRDELDRERSRADRAEAEAARAWATAGEAGPEVERLALEVDHWRAAAERLALEADRRPLLADRGEDDTVQIGGRSYSTRATAEALGIPKSTLTRKLAQLDQKESTNGR